MRRQVLPRWLTVTDSGVIAGPDGPLGHDGEVYGRLAGWPAGLVPRPAGWSHGEALGVPAPLMPWVLARLEHHGGQRSLSAVSGSPRSPGVV